MFASLVCTRDEDVAGAAETPSGDRDPGGCSRLAEMREKLGTHSSVSVVGTAASVETSDATTATALGVGTPVATTATALGVGTPVSEGITIAAEEGYEFDICIPRCRSCSFVGLVGTAASVETSGATTATALGVGTPVSTGGTQQSKEHGLDLRPAGEITNCDICIPRCCFSSSHVNIDGTAASSEKGGGTSATPVSAGGTTAREEGFEIGPVGEVVDCDISIPRCCSRIEVVDCGFVVDSTSAITVRTSGTEPAYGPVQMANPTAFGTLAEEGFEIGAAGEGSRISFPRFRFRFCSSSFVSIVGTSDETTGAETATALRVDTPVPADGTIASQSGAVVGGVVD
jgi:hypothetical protein